MASTNTTPMSENDGSSSKAKKKQTTPVKTLVHFASTEDKLLMAVGILCGLCYGVKYILAAIAIGGAGGVLSTVSLSEVYRILSSEVNSTQPRTALVGYHSISLFRETYGLHASLADVVTQAIYKMIIIIGSATVVTILCFFGMTITLERAAANQVNRMRMAFTRSILRQDIDWFDNCQTSKFISQTENDLKTYQDGIGFKLGHLISYISAYIIPFIYSMVVQWRLALVGYSTAPAFMLAYKYTTMIQKKYSAKETKSYSNAGVVAEDVLTAFKTVIGSNGQASEVQRYCQKLVKGRTSGIVKTILTAFGHAFFLTTMVTTFALSGWYADHLYRTLEGYAQQKDTVTDLITILTLISLGGLRIGEIFGLANYVSMAISSSSRVLEVINKVPSYDCDTNSDSKHLITTIDTIEFKDVEFNYSSRKEATVLRNFNLLIKKGEKVALVGNSGSGKSTVVSLLHRFYDPVKGLVRINGYDIKELNLGWLRSQIGVVSQEPVLFPVTIHENIRYGYAGASMEDIEMAAKMANAHNFIMELPLKYETNVGDRGTRLSGGQKQRIAIARALIRKPPILLLDEATSALDSQSEMIVQQAIDSASVGRTSIIIAHRLSTIRNADKIVVMDGGEIAESGNHDSLMKSEGVYYRLVNAQMECGGDELRIRDDPSFNEDHVNEEDGPEEIIDSVSPRRDIKIDIIKQKWVEPEKDINLSAHVGHSMMRFAAIRKTSLFRILTLGVGGPIFMFMGLVFGVIQGTALMEFFITVMPFAIVIFEDHDRNSGKGLFLYLYEIMKFGSILVIADLFMILFSGLSGAIIANRLRGKLFYSFLRQEVSWYEKSRSSVGNLCLILSHDIESVKMALSTHLNAVVTVAAQTITGLVVLFRIAWQYGCLVAFGFAVAFTLAIYTQQRLHNRILKEAERMRMSNEILRDIVMNIRTIRFLNAEEEFEKLYHQNSIRVHSKKDEFNRYLLAVLATFMDNISQLVIVFVGLLSPMLFLRNEIVIIGFFKAWGIAGMANMLGRTVSVMPNVTSAMVSVEKIFKIIDRTPEMDNFSREGTVLATEQPGSLHFNQVTFAYPTRPKCKALKMFEMSVKSNQTIAIVGSSGSGKSTCVQLAARFYDPLNGSVYVCDELVKTIEFHSLRQVMAIVQQEPMVFNRSIAENIAYGDLTRAISMEEIVEAAKIAHAHDFICELPQGYETVVGNRGTQISGGQKQRIAIARAVIRKPKLLLLDEATSALDSETDKEVQIALRNNKHRSTIVIIAHRLSTITDADQIFVVHHGQVVENGKHSELMDLNGLYTKLYQNQVKS